MRFIRKIGDGVAFVEGIAVVLLLAVMVLLSFSQVILRNFFDSGLTWADVVLRHQVLWVGFIGASLATRENRHIGIDVMSKLLPDRYVLLLRSLLGLGGAVVCGFLAKAGWVFIQNERDFGTKLFADLPVWPFQIIIPIGFALIGVRFFIQVFDFAGAFIQNDLSRLPKQEGQT